MAGFTSAQRTALAELLGEPVMVDDPLITVPQAAGVLNLTPDRVRDMIHLGELPAHDHPDGRRANRRLRLSDVVALADRPTRITVTDAAAILHESVITVQRLAAAGLLTLHPGPWPLLPGQVRRLATRRRGWLTVAQAADRAQSSPQRIRQILEDGLLKDTGDPYRPINRAQLDAVSRTSAAGAGHRRNR